MPMLKEITKNIPAIDFVYRVLKKRYSVHKLKSKTAEEVFSEIHKSNTWGGDDSVSGTGSDVYQTRLITSELPAVFNELNISTLLDLPCGDFHWMKDVNLDNMDYIGADIVNELIQENSEKYARDGVRFHNINLIEDKLPKVDLVFCRDCLVHLSFADIFSALGNLCDSQSEYLLATTFTERKSNHDIITGQWRVLNLELAPFMFPKPLRILNEGCTEYGFGGVTYRDKALGLWRIADIQKSLTKAVRDC